MSAASAGERLLTFEVGASLFAIPIEGVLEVAEHSGEACVPTVPADVACVINYRGDALPVVRRARILELEDDAAEPTEHVLVVTDRRSAVPRLGLAVDRVLGLVDGGAPVTSGPSVVAARRQIGGRVACVLDPARIVARAREVIEGSLERGRDN